MSMFFIKRRAVSALLLMLLWVSAALAQSSLIDQASRAYEVALSSEISLKETPTEQRTRSEYLRVIRLYERVYLITPHTGYADNALINIAGLYEEIGDAKDAVTTLDFLVREYPGSRFVSDARADIARLAGTNENSAENSRGSEPGGVVLVDNIRYWESQRSVRVVVDMNGQASFVQGEAQDPPRVFVDIANSRVGASLKERSFPVESVMLENVRIGQYNTDTVRVVLDLVRLSDTMIFTLSDPDRIVIDVLGEPRETTDISRSGTPAPLLEARGGTDATATAETVSSEAADLSLLPAARPAENADGSLIRSLGLKVARVVIDAGHGGRDTGTIGPSGLTEKDLVLDIARRLKARIESELHAEVVLTREDDSFVPLETRTAIANQAEADLFLSIHANSSDIQSIRGFETYFLNFATSREDSEIAARENASSAQSISELQDLVSKILLRDKTDESREFAGHIQRALASFPNSGRNRGVKQAPFVVLIGANMPSILSEISFISNPEDEKLLKNSERREEIAGALFEGVRSYSETLSGFETAQAQQ